MSSHLPLPKYHQIYLVLKERLAEYADGAGFPGEFALMKEFDAGRVTVRRALDALVREGLITRKPGRGTRVCVPEASTEEASARRARSGLLDNLVHVSLGTSVQVVSLEVLGATRTVAEPLGIAEGDAVQKAVRVRSTPLGPLSVIVTHVPLWVAPAFEASQLSQKPLLMLLEEQGVVLGRAEQSLSARLADAAHAAWLDIPVGAALISVRRVVHDQDDRPIQLLQGLYRPDRYEYEMSLSRGGDIDTRVWISTALKASFQ